MVQSQEDEMRMCSWKGVWGCVRKRGQPLIAAPSFALDGCSRPLHPRDEKGGVIKQSMKRDDRGRTPIRGGRAEGRLTVYDQMLLSLFGAGSRGE